MSSRPQGNGIVALHDEYKEKESGFNCIKLIQFLTEAGVTDWGQWHGAHFQAAAGQCPYKGTCPICERTQKKGLKNGIQLEFELF